MTNQTLDAVQAKIPDRYVLERELGAGGMATVYLAKDSKLDRPVAVKILNPELSLSVAADRFLQEVKIAGKLSHPRILHVYDWGSSGDTLFYVMQYVAGESLHDRIKREHQLSIDEAVAITCEVADAVQYANDKGVVHRDIKPENILIHEGHPLLADFGIALALTAARGRMTDAGIAVGTPAYMSPEQALGETRIDGRTDIYALACVLYEMLVGEPAFDGPSHQAIIRRKTMEALPSARIIRESVPERLDEAIRKALANYPADRFATAADFANALTRALERTDNGRTVTPRPTGPPSNSVAVLPFVNLSRDPDDEFFSDGLTEEVLNTVSRVPTLRVAARTSSFAFKGKNQNVRTIATQLNVAHLLEGSVRRAGKRVRIDVGLVNAQTNHQRWSERYDRDLEDVFQIQDEIAREVATVLEARLTGPTESSEAQQATVDPEAYVLYLKGRHQLSKRIEPTIRKGIAYFKQALEIETGYAAAHAGLAESFAILGVYGVVAPDESMPKAEESAKRALALDQTLADAHATVGLVNAMYRWDWTVAEQHFIKAIECGPAHAVARLWFALNCLAPRGRFADATTQLVEARARDPLSPIVASGQGILRYFARDFEHAAKSLQDVIEGDPDFGLAYFFLGQVFVELAQFDAAIAALEKAVSLSQQSSETLSALGYALALSGAKPEARAKLDQLQDREKTSYVSPVLIAQIHAGLGQVTESLAALERAHMIRAADFIWLGLRPAFDGLRPEPRFQALVDSTGVSTPPIP